MVKYENTIYELDTFSSIIDNICELEEVLPEFVKLYYDENLTIPITVITSSTEIYYTTIKNIIKSNSLAEVAFEETKKHFEIQPKNFIVWWIIYKKSKEDDFKVINFCQIFVVSSTNSFLEAKNLEKILKTELENLSSQINENKFFYKEFSKVKPIATTESELISTKTEITFEVDYDIYELFNNLKMSWDIPFATINDYYKIKDNFIPSKQWTYSRERFTDNFTRNVTDILYLKVLNIKNLDIVHSEIDPELYTTVSIYFEKPRDENRIKRIADLEKLETKLNEENEDLNKEIKAEKKKKKEANKLLIIELEEKINENIKKLNNLLLSQNDEPISNISKVHMFFDMNINFNLTKEEMIKRIFYTFPIPVINYTEHEIQVKAEFLIPDFYLDKYLFLDVLTNNKKFYHKLFLDESNGFTKNELVGNTRGGVFIHYDKISISLTEQIVEKPNLNLIKKGMKVDSNYLKVKVTRAQNLKVVDNFKKIFAKYITLYNDEKEKIKQKYKKYLANFDDFLEKVNQNILLKRKKSTREKIMLKDYDPELFKSDYSRECPLNRHPRIVEKEEFDELVEDNKYPIVFPKDKFDQNHEYKQFYYSCDHHPDFPYIGVKENKKMSNKSLYPLIPCCYKEDVRGGGPRRKKSLWKIYYEEGKKFSDFSGYQKDLENEQNEKHIYTSNKILNPKRLGILNKDVQSFFSSIDDENSYYRKGMNRTNNSFLECLLIATEPTNENAPLNEKLIYFAEKRKELAKMITNNSEAFQNMIMISQNPEGISEYILDKNKYLDPKIFVSLLEKMYNIQIFIFSENNENPNGYLASPYYINEYLHNKYKPETPIVIIYEHQPKDNIEFPQCELIIMLKENTARFLFPYNFRVSINIKKSFKLMYENELDKFLPIPNFNQKIISVGIDYFGKTRFLQFKDLAIYTNPIASLNLPLGYVYKPVEYNVALKFFNKEEIKPKYIYENDKVVCLEGIKGNVFFSILIIPIKLKNQEEEPKKNFLNSPTKKTSLLEEYNNNLRIARYLIEYTLYFFSIDYYKYNPKNININYLEEFASRNFLIDSSFEYSKIPRIFNKDCKGLIKNKKIVVHSEKIMKKLVYNLRMRLRINYKETINYRDYKYIQLYYADVKDFTTIKNQVIIQGSEALNKWITVKINDYSIKEKVETVTNLFKELIQYDNEKPFVVIFCASWNKNSTTLINRIREDKYIKGKLSKKLCETYYYVNFIFIDIENNENLANFNNINNVPTILIGKLNKEAQNFDVKIRYEANTDLIKTLKNKIGEYLSLP
jgi:hypothetical protein